MRRAVARSVGQALALAALASAPLAAQGADSLRAGVRRDALLVPDSVAVVASAPAVDGPPISPRRAFLYSLVLPGAGQTQLDRAYAGGLFLLVEVTTLALIQRSSEDLRIARRFRGDSIPSAYQINPVSGLAALDTLGNPIVTQWARSRYTDAWIRTRRLHREDWMALLIFNHLFAGADAYVAAQLWDLPAKLSVRATPRGAALTASVAFR